MTLMLLKKICSLQNQGMTQQLIYVGKFYKCDTFPLKLSLKYTQYVLKIKNVKLTTVVGFYTYQQMYNCYNNTSSITTNF